MFDAPGKWARDYRSIGLGIAVLAEERGLRQASARIANAFYVIIAAPGSEANALPGTVYRQHANLALMSSPVNSRATSSCCVRSVRPVE